MAKSKGAWIPQQHGAWAMLIVPLLVGLALRSREGLPLWVWPLAATWLLGYFCFNACSLWLKSAVRRRLALRPAILTYGSLTTVAGAATLATGGVSLLWWVPVYIPLLATALWLAAHHRERALLGGLCTVAAACLLAWIIPFTTPQALWQHGLDRTSWPAVALFGYFFGTVFVVKTLIRERGKESWVWASIGWHAIWTMICVVAATAGVAPVGWMVFFAVATVRAWALPWFGPRRGRTIRPGQVGILEIAMSLAALIICLNS